MSKKNVYLIVSTIFIIASAYILFNKYSEYKTEQKNNEEYKLAHNKLEKEWKDVKLIYPEKLYSSIDNKEISINNYLKQSKKEFTLISYMDCNCSTCVGDLKKWEALMKENSEFNNKIDLVFIIISSDVEMLKYQIYDQAKSKFDFLWDKDNKFSSINKIPEMKAYQTFLIKDDKIKFIGSPLYGKFYLERIKKIISEY